MNLIRTLNARDGKTVILVTHDAAMAEAYATRTVTLLDGHVISDTGRPLAGASA